MGLAAQQAARLQAVSSGKNQAPVLLVAPHICNLRTSA